MSKSQLSVTVLDAGGVRSLHQIPLEGDLGLGKRPEVASYMSTR